MLQAILTAGPGAVARPIDPAVVQAVAGLPGPIGPLLRRGVDPAVALGVQRAWEGALLGGKGALPGQAVAPVWERWGLGDARALDALAQRLTGRPAGASELAGADRPPSSVAAGLLGLRAAIPSGVVEAALARLDPRRLEAALLGLGNADGAVGLNGLVRLAGMPDTLAGAVALTAAAAADAPLLLVALGPGTAAAGDRPIALGAGLVLHAAPAADGAPASATVAWNGPAPAGPGQAGPLLARVVQAVLGALVQGAPARGGPAVGAALQVPLLDGGPVLGTVCFAGGGAVALGPEPAPPRGGRASSGAPPLGVGAPPRREAQAVLALGGGALDGGWSRLDTLGAHVRYEERRAVALDLSPEAPASPAWRLDDTGASAALEADGIDAALARAKRLYGRVQAGGFTLDGLPPGHGIDTWDGSPAWLGLAGVAKPAALGVLPGEASPPRLDLSRGPDGAWLVVRRGGAEGCDARRPHPPDAADSIGLFQDAVFGLAPDASLCPPGGEAGAMALRGFRRARAGMGAPPPGADPAVRARAQEAWGLVARLWAGALERMGRSGLPGRLSPRGLPAVQAGALREIAARCGPVPAWHAAHAAGLDRGALLAACDAPARAEVARALAPAAALVCLLGEPARGGADPDWAAEARLLATGAAEALLDWGRAALRDAAGGRPDALGWGDAVALAVRLGRVGAA